MDRNYGEYMSQNFDAQSTLLGMDRQRIDYCWLYPSQGLGVLAIDGQDPALAAAIARAYNNWLHDYCNFSPDRLRPVAIVSLHRPDDAVDEVKRVFHELGMRAVT